MLIARFDNRTIEYDKVEQREAARAVIKTGDKYLMVHISTKDVFVFPGGGVESGETLEQTCVREALEEAGAHVEIINYMGYLEELWDSKFGEMSYQLKSHYFLCELTGMGEQSLLGYEQLRGFRPREISAIDALKKNKLQRSDDNTRYLSRNIYLLTKLVENSL